MQAEYPNKKMEQAMNQKFKHIYPVVILLLLFSILTFYFVSNQYSRYKMLEEAENNIKLATKLSKLLHETQKERGLSVGFLANKGKIFYKKLKLQRTKSDEVTRRLKDFENKYKFDITIKDSLTIVLINISKLKKTRALIDSFAISTMEILTYYSKINSNILDTIIKISKASYLSGSSQNIVAYSNFLYSKEYAGIERALGTGIISQKILDQKQINSLNSLITKQEIFKNLFLQYATHNLKIDYYNIYKDKSIKIIKNMEKIILSSRLKNINKLSPKVWFENSTKKINILKIIENHITKKIIFNIKNNLKNTLKNLIKIIILVVISFVVFFTMIYIILNLIKSEERLKNLINKYVILSTTNLKGIITEATDAFCNISGYKRKELIGKPHNIVRHPDMSKNTFKKLWETIKKNKTWKGNVKNINKNGDYYWVEAIISPVYNIFGKKVGYSAIRQNISDKIKIEDYNYTLEQKIKEAIVDTKEKEKLLQEQSRHAQMGEMISMIAHQWRQPLAAISSTSAAINLKAKLDKLDKENAINLSSKISSYSQHLSQTIDDFREFFKKNKEKKEITYTELINSVLSIIEESVQNKNITLIKELSCEEKLYTYTNEIKQVILNLIKNAEDILLEKSIEKPCIKVITYKEGDALILEISDNAGGIPENIIDKIFDPYFSTKIKKDGTGLGLYMSKTIIEEHCNGKISVTNGEDGAIFKIELEANNG